ncbi:MAG: hypothetical protein IT458_03980 [Planctomycetes bacterium]|nr:hypothetical protein [Planctomycetota bacterium]
MIRSCLVALALALAPLVPAQGASYTLFGTACGTPGFSPSLGVRGVPRLGTTFTVTYGGPNLCGFLGPISFRYRPILLTGVSRSAMGGIALPWQVPPALAGGANCLLLQSTDVVLPMPATPGGANCFASEAAFAVPNVPALLGVEFYQQWLAWLERFDSRTSTTTYTLLLSEGGHAKLGT